VPRSPRSRHNDGGRQTVRDPAGWKHLQRFLRLWTGRAISANRPGFYEARARALAGTGEGMLLDDALRHFRPGG
jgi:hypothetical protein